MYVKALQKITVLLGEVGRVQLVLYNFFKRYLNVNQYYYIDQSYQPLKNKYAFCPLYYRVVSFIRLTTAKKVICCLTKMVNLLIRMMRTCYSRKKDDLNLKHSTFFRSTTYGIRNNKNTLIFIYIYIFCNHYVLLKITSLHTIYVCNQRIYIASELNLTY